MKKSTLITLFAVTAAMSIPVRAGDVGEAWDKTCVKCHGADGKGDTKMGKKAEVKDFTDAKVQAAFTDSDAFKALKEGLKDADGKIRMKPVEDLSDDDIKELIKRVRAFKP